MDRSQVSVAFHTLGCKVNQYEADALGARFARAGYRLCSFEDDADVYVVNTCTVTSLADHKSRKMIRRKARQNPQSLVVVTGCHAAAWSDALGGVRVLKIPQMEKESLFEQVEEALFGASSEMPENFDYHTTPSALMPAGFGDAGAGPVDFRKGSSPTGARTRATLKVQDGCDRFCTYCIIPYVRGRSRSRRVNEVMNEAAQLIGLGFKEIVITGICVGDFGADLNPRETFSGLLERLLEIPYAGRFRLSSFDPCDADEKLIDLVTRHPRFCRHLHLALQHGSDRILKKMGRTYTRDQFSLVCGELKKRDSLFSITTDIITGFPGETDEDFHETLRLAESAGFSKIHVFPYSERKGTGAVRHKGKVNRAVRDARTQTLLDLSSRLSGNFISRNLGTRHEVLVERERDKESKRLQGYTSNYIPVLLEGSDRLAGRLAPVILESLERGKAKGKISEVGFHSEQTELMFAEEDDRASSYA